MSFPKVPNYSKNELNKAGKILIKDRPGEFEYPWAVGILDKWRACHAYPVNTLQATLRKKVKLLNGEVIVAQRLKRLSTIIDKLKRYPDMNLARMQDIGGLRAIVGSIKDVNKLNLVYQKSKFKHELVSTKNYIEYPKNSGYRGIHLIYKYKNSRAPSYNGLQIELQLRTKLQHAWATSVETMGTFLGKALKSSQGDQEWLKFFALTASAFAHLEKTPPIPGYENLSKKETFQAVIEIEKKLGVMDKMRAFTTAAKTIHKDKDGKGWFYHLIILNSKENKIQINSYARDQLKQATKDYSKAEDAASRGAEIEPVLVSAGPLKSLRTAYPNYFLDTKEFIKIIQQIITSGKN